MILNNFILLNSFQKIIYKVLIFFIIFLFTDNHILFASIELPDMYRFAETNMIATALCSTVKFMSMIIVPISAIMFTVIGFNAFQGKLNWGVFVTFAIGIGTFRSAGVILDMFIPGIGLQYGCDCAVSVIVRKIGESDSQSFGIQNSDVSTGIDSSCCDKNDSNYSDCIAKFKGKFY